MGSPPHNHKLLYIHTYTLTILQTVTVVYDGLTTNYDIFTTPRQVFHLRTYYAEELLSRPQWPRLHDRWSGDLAVPRIHPHQEVHHKIALHECVPLGHLTYPEQGILLPNKIQEKSFTLNR